MQVETEPPPKRQRPLAPAGRKTPQHLDLRLPLSDHLLKSQKREVDVLLKLLRKKKKIVVIAGAGISVGAGIPDFRSAGGLFSTLRTDMKLKASGRELFDASVYKDDQLTSSFHDMVRNLHTLTAQATPTQFHHLLATLATQGRLLRLYSQNVDCIDTQLEPLKTVVPLGNKGPWPRTIQLHGGLEKMVCSKCGWLAEFEASLFRGSEPPDCSECVEMDCVRGIAGKRALGVGKLRPRIVLYNEFNPDAEAIGAVTKADLKARPDCLIVVGTSLKVPGVRRIVREMCGVVQDYRGGMTVWINEDDPPMGREFEGAFDLIVSGDCEKVAKMASLPRWDGSEQQDAETDSDSCGSFIEVDNSGPPRSSDTVEIHVPQLLSPSISPHPKIGKTARNSNKRSAPDPQAGPPAKRSKTKAKPAPPVSAKGRAIPPVSAKAKAKAEFRKKIGPLVTTFKTVKQAVITKPIKAKVTVTKTAAAKARLSTAASKRAAAKTSAAMAPRDVTKVATPAQVIPTTPPAPASPIPAKSTTYGRSPPITIASLLN